ncbi:MAG TPA: hypothetical protein VK859_16005 [bacterium]|jgi:hypothetical protein|nr:hypothetical protein [bacterium]
MPKPFLKSDFKAAIRDPRTAMVYTGFDHSGALKKAEAAGVEFPQGQLDPAHTGFLRKDGTFFTRAQAKKEYGFENSSDLR